MKDRVTSFLKKGKTGWPKFKKRKNRVANYQKKEKDRVANLERERQGCELLKDSAFASYEKQRLRQSNNSNI